jgi:HK97 gp10 family phage protein
MAITTQVRITGFRELEANLKVLREQFGVKTGGVIYRGLQAGANLVRDEARRRIPHIQSGYVPFETLRKKVGRGKKKRTVSRRNTASARKALLRSNIIAHKIPHKARLAEGKPTVLVRVRNSAYRRINGKIRFRRPGSSPGWWWWLEFGTSKRPATPFMRPAFEAQKMAAIEEMRRHVSNEINTLFAKFGQGLKRAA